MAKKRANGDVCEYCRWQMKQAKKSGRNKEYREVNNDRYGKCTRYVKFSPVVDGKAVNDQ